MNFKDILEDWERLSARPGGLDGAAEAERRLRAEEARLKAQKAADSGKPEPSTARDALAAWLDSHGTPSAEGREVEAGAGAGSGRERDVKEAEARRLRALKPEARIDLHGLKAAEAEAALAAFLEAASRRGLEKILVVTGKGIHSQGEPVLGKVARRVIETSPWAGRFGTADAASGGGGALWVILRRKDHFSR